ncbi:calreticulin-3 isoform X2 [Perognathus longimembris pacificus]|uniref:calreticulin-3 isoform X2 n=1 Tax=Perognathus longimembris pacificus TaxID=214514 RepID=UPI002018B4DD|nr:calreticulin-3 isoform X2 [Perognathus longimembris pacificus]
MVPARVAAFCAVCALRVVLATVYFQEEFLDGERWRNRWVQSTNDSKFGHFTVSSGKFYGHKEKDKGLQTTQNGRFYAISARFKPFSNKGKTLVVQYTVKHEQKMDCGGGYVKIFPADLDQKNLNGKSPYYIMFGPDICGFDIKKVHVILHFKNQYHPNKKHIRCKDWEKHFLDTSAPSDWNSELDGDWQAAMLQKPPYQDGLRAEGIDQDVWLHQKMQSASYLLQHDLSEFENIGAIGLELWQVRSGTIFDNFLITDDEEYAVKFGKATWGETKDPEREMDAIQAKEELKRAREEDDEEMLMGKFLGRDGRSSQFHRRDGL